MNNIARAYHWPLRKEDWESHAYSPISAAEQKVGSELDNDIHSMFSYELDEYPHRTNSKARWGRLTLEEYKLLDQPLRLATQLLESAPSSDAILSIVYGERRPSPEHIIRRNIPVFEFRKHTQQPALVRERATQALKQLGKSIRFCMTSLDNDTKLAENTHGSTSPVTTGYPDGISIIEASEPTGLASIVFISPVYLRMLKELLVEGLNKQFMTLKLYFEIAITLCHEVMHAVNLAFASDLLQNYIARGKQFVAYPYNEPFYEGQDVAEVGYFWEKHVFGGACMQSMPHNDRAVFLGEWPSWLFRDRDEQPERALPRKRALKWLVSAHYIKNIQTREFWTKINLQHPQDLLALRIHKRVTVKSFVPPDYWDYDQTWDPEAPENKLGDYPRVLWPDTEQSPGGRLANETHS